MLQPTDQRRILVAWIGHADLVAWGKLDGHETEKAVQGLLKNKDWSLKDGSDLAKGHAPLVTMLRKATAKLGAPFTDVHLMTDMNDLVIDQFVDSIQTDHDVHCRLHRHKLKTPVDYREIYDATVRTLELIAPAPDDAMWMNLSSGTPAMVAVLLLLGKSLYPARFLQAYRGNATEESIAFSRIQIVGAMLAQEPSGVAEGGGFSPVKATGARMKELVRRCRIAAKTDCPVLLLGESGVGKEVFAQAIHETSNRAGGPFVPLNCAALSDNLLESELFGHVKGAFTDAKTDRAGAFASANGGTLFLDEIGECSPAIQAKLLRVLQPKHGEPRTTRRFRPVGSDTEQTADVRIIGATNRDLVRMMADGRFREDLYHRLSDFPARIPPLRERREEFAAIAEQALADAHRDLGLRPDDAGAFKKFGPGCLEFLRAQPWPGNIRSLRKCLMRAVMFADGNELRPHDFDFEPIGEGPAMPAVGAAEGFPGFEIGLKEYLDAVQKAHIIEAGRRSGWKKAEAARLLKYENYQTLDGQIRRHTIDWPPHTEN